MKKYILGLIAGALLSYQSFGQITRTQIHFNAIPFTTYTFTTTSSNIHSNTNCSAVGNINTPSWVAVGANKVGMPYCWGGFSSESSFTTGLTKGLSAGDDDCTTSGDCCESCALGVDCSGFVSHAWALTTKYSTTTLPNICTTYASAMDVKQGDIFDLPGSHTRLVDTNYENGTFLLMESSAVDWKVSYRSYTTSQLTSYTPMYYVKVDSNGTCTNKYASLPYTTSFENTWAFDSCNNGSQRIPDIYWKSSIGGTSPDGDDYWHRDDYTGADWTTPTNGAYTPTASKGTYSARFHNDPPPAGSTGALDLYIDLSKAGSKTISFDYIHNEVSPSPFSFDVMLSTDGGSTFPATLMTITSAQVSTWTTQSCTTSATSATSVIRFIVTDKGTADVGVDNLNVTLTSLTGVDELSANNGFEIYPNPTDGSVLNCKFAEQVNKDMSIHIYDMLGKEVLTKQVFVSGSMYTLTNTQLAPGTYMFVGTTDNGRYMKTVIVK